ncbi:hypothetical protein B0H13DRAFT_2057605 [Mycena leptocephala]|jgi:hypothetical protein|nr:hypothetical protein B0H13DRAFT_2057605 [Mycena leptocephala]
MQTIILLVTIPRSPLLGSSIDRDILAQANCEGEVFPFHGDYMSHILLAACAEEERAYERSTGHYRCGAFTEALTN